ncbi:MAG: hypothetical protein IIA67_05095 [Planctomycetes bacterium]|nr:hypothetical protein [Planctomycetota bacterium]
MSKAVWGIALLVAVSGLIAVGTLSGKFEGDDPQGPAPAPASADEGSSSASDAGLPTATQTVSIKVPGMT